MKECYIKGDESDTEKKARDVKERVSNTKGSQHSRKRSYTFPVMDKTKFKHGGKVLESFKPLNTRRENIWREAFHLHDIHMPPTPKEDVSGLELDRWCKFHKVKGHHIKDFYHLKKGDIAIDWRGLPQ